MRHAILAFDDSIGRGEAFIDIASSDQKSLEDIVRAVKELARKRATVRSSAPESTRRTRY